MLDVKPDIKPLPERRYDCKWGGCRHFAATNGESNPHVVAKHIKTHLPDDSPQSAHRMRHNRVPPPDSETDSPLASNPTSAKAQKYFLNTATDERNDAAGLPLASVLVLRNLARGFGKMDAASGGDENWVRSVFAPVKEQLYFVMAYNLSLREYIASLTRAVAAAGGRECVRRGERRGGVRRFGVGTEGQLRMWWAGGRGLEEILEGCVTSGRWIPGLLFRVSARSWESFQISAVCRISTERISELHQLFCAPRCYLDDVPATSQI